MEREHAFVVLKAFFPNAYILNVRENITYLIGRTSSISSDSTNNDWILYVVNENESLYNDMVWDPAGFDKWIPVERLTEEKLLDIIRRIKVLDQNF